MKISQSLAGNSLASTYQNAKPFPHIVLRDFWDSDSLKAVSDEVKGFDFFEGEKDFYGAKKKRYCGTYDKLPPLARDLIDSCHSFEFLKFLEEMTGQSDLVSDPYLLGGGIHSITTDGYLKVHADFNWHKQLQLYRRINLLIYLNPGWNPNWGGELELWTQDMKRKEVSVEPQLNTMVVFTTDDSSFHGHPDALKCPEGVTRDSIALYYYSPARTDDEKRRLRDTTDYRARGLMDREVAVKSAKEKISSLFNAAR